MGTADFNSLPVGVISDFLKCLLHILLDFFGFHIPYNGKPTQRAWRWKPKQAVLTLSGVGFAVLNRTLFTHSFWIALSLNCDVKDC